MFEKYRLKAKCKNMAINAETIRNTWCNLCIVGSVNVHSIWTPMHRPRELERKAFVLDEDSPKIIVTLVFDALYVAAQFNQLLQQRKTPEISSHSTTETHYSQQDNISITSNKIIRKINHYLQHDKLMKQNYLIQIYVKLDSTR